MLCQVIYRLFVFLNNQGLNFDLCRKGQSVIILQHERFPGPNYKSSNWFREMGSDEGHIFLYVTCSSIRDWLQYDQHLKELGKGHNLAN